MKLFFICFIGIGSLPLALIVFPLLRLIIKDEKKYKRAARFATCYSFKFFRFCLSLLNVSFLKVSDKKRMENLKSKIVVANHPSILDVVMLVSEMKNADCIVRGNLTKSIFAPIIKQIYTINSLGYEEMIDLAKKSLSDECNLIVFPEGTRTPRHGTNKFKRGAARIALATGYNIQPIYIGGTDKYGLGKYDAFFSFNPSGAYHYNLYLLPEIDVKNYSGLEQSIAARRVTEKIYEEIAQAAKEIDNRIV